MGKKQHYIPQFYLKNFSDKNQKSVGVFRFEDQKFIWNASIKNIAYRNNLYDDDNSIESFLAEEEGKWKGLVDIFLGKNVTQATLKMLQEHGDEHVIDLFRFISITEARTAQYGDALTYIIKSMDEKLGTEMH